MGEKLPEAFRSAVLSLDDDGEPRGMVCVWLNDGPDALNYIECVGVEDRARMAKLLRQRADALDG